MLMNESIVYIEEEEETKLLSSEFLYIYSLLVEVTIIIVANIHYVRYSTECVDHCSCGCCDHSFYNGNRRCHSNLQKVFVVIIYYQRAYRF